VAGDRPEAAGRRPAFDPLQLILQTGDPLRRPIPSHDPHSPACVSERLGVDPERAAWGVGRCVEWSLSYAADGCWTAAADAEFASVQHDSVLKYGPGPCEGLLEGRRVLVVGAGTTERRSGCTGRQRTAIAVQCAKARRWCAPTATRAPRPRRRH
jgi:hypothetical protein